MNIFCMKTKAFLSRDESLLNYSSLGLSYKIAVCKKLYCQKLKCLNLSLVPFVPFRT